MVCGVDIHRQGWMYFFEFLYGRDGNMRVLFTEMQHDRNLWFFRRELRNASAIIRHRRGDAIHARRRKPCHSSAETETNDAYFSGLRCFRYCRADVEEGFVLIDFLHIAEA